MYYGKVKCLAFILKSFSSRFSDFIVFLKGKQTFFCTRLLKMASRSIPLAEVIRRCVRGGPDDENSDDENSDESEDDISEMSEEVKI